MRRLRGFSLVESAIVLALMGLVLGGVFSLVSVTRAHLKLNEGLDDLTLIVGNVRSYYVGRPYPTLGLADCPASFTSTYRMPKDGTAWTKADHEAYGIFPLSMRFTAGSTTYVNNPFKGAVNETTALVDFCGSNPTYFAVRYSALTRQECIDMIERTAVDHAGMGLYQIVVNSTTRFVTERGSTSSNVSKASGAVPLDNAVSACSKSDANVLDWQYSITGD